MFLYIFLIYLYNFKINKMKTEEFIEKSKNIHGNKYDYSKVEYKRNDEKVCIICPKHGEFWQTPNSHLNGYGCHKCSHPIFKGTLYDKLGFKHDHDSAPNYFYIIGDRRENRFKYRKDRLIKEGFDQNKTEHEIMLERGIYRIYDCGTKVWIWNQVNNIGN